MKFNSIIILASFCIGLVIGYFVFHEKDSNADREYNDGLPSNCRALIYESEFDYRISKKYTQEELLISIFRNCGETGVLWKK